MLNTNLKVLLITITISLGSCSTIDSIFSDNSQVIKPAQVDKTCRLVNHYKKHTYSIYQSKTQLTAWNDKHTSLNEMENLKKKVVCP